jgi:hypothetical protein
MARDEAPREDLMREAVALVRRIELELDAEPAPVVVGFRRDGSVSLFFGDDPVVQFNSYRELRRGYSAGRLLKAEHGRLVSLTRQLTERQTRLVRHELTERETASYLSDIQARLHRLRRALHEGRVGVLRQAPENQDVLAEARRWIDSLADPIPIAHSPAAG